MIYAVLQGVWVLYRINKVKGGESVSSSFSKTCCQCRFSEIFKGRQIIYEPYSYDDAKHYQVQSEHGRIQNTFKHLSRNVFA